MSENQGSAIRMVDGKLEVPNHPILPFIEQQERFNPVPISVEDSAIWQSHWAKRINLYQRHLRIPFSLLRNRSVLEIGCNSGENALVLASVGANLTLIEPNDQVRPRIETIFLLVFSMDINSVGVGISSGPVFWLNLSHLQ